MQEKSIRLPARLRGVVRSDPPAAATVTPHQPIPDAETVRQRQAIEDVLQSLRGAAAELQAKHQLLLKSLQKAAVDLAVAVAGRFLHQRLTTGEFAVETLVQQAIERLEPRQAVSVALHPDDLTILEKRLAEEPRAALHGRDVKFSADSSVHRGGCKVQSGEIMVMTDLDEKLAELHGQLLESVETAREAQSFAPAPKQNQSA
jgi:flagellar biosynthesis/type III secretory pathway protein FliH